MADRENAPTLHPPPSSDEDTATSSLNVCEQAMRIPMEMLQSVFNRRVSLTDELESLLDEQPQREAGLRADAISVLEDKFTRNLLRFQMAERDLAHVLGHLGQTGSSADKAQALRKILDWRVAHLYTIEDRLYFLGRRGGLHYTMTGQVDEVSDEGPLPVIPLVVGSPDIYNQDIRDVDIRETTRLYILFRQRHDLPLYFNFDAAALVVALAEDPNEPWSERRVGLMVFLDIQYPSVNPYDAWSERGLRIMAFLNAQQTIASALHPSYRIVDIAHCGDQLRVYNLNYQEAGMYTMPCREDRVAVALPLGHRQTADLASLTSFYITEMQAAHNARSEEKTLEAHKEELNRVVGDFAGAVDEKTKCQICLATFESGECAEPTTIVDQRCMCRPHTQVYGRACIINWLLGSKSCPVCREEVREDFSPKEVLAKNTIWHGYFDGYDRPEVVEIDGYETAHVQMTEIWDQVRQIQAGRFEVPTFEEDYANAGGPDNFDNSPLDWKIMADEEPEFYYDHELETVQRSLNAFAFTKRQIGELTDVIYPDGLERLRTPASALPEGTGEVAEFPLLAAETPILDQSVETPLAEQSAEGVEETEESLRAGGIKRSREDMDSDDDETAAAGTERGIKRAKHDTPTDHAVQADSKEAAGANHNHEEEGPVEAEIADSIEKGEGKGQIGAEED